MTKVNLLACSIGRSLRLVPGGFLVAYVLQGASRPRGHLKPVFVSSAGSGWRSSTPSMQDERKNPGCFQPGVLLEFCQTIGIRSCAEHEG